MLKKYLQIRDIGYQGAWKILDRALSVDREQTLHDKTVAILFESAAMSERISYDVAIRRLGGDVIYSTPAESQLGRSEPLRDTARVLSRYVDAIVVHTSTREKTEELAQWSSVPVLNAFDNLGNPSLILADIMILRKHDPDFLHTRVTWIGDGTGAANSWIEAAIYFPFELFMAVPVGLEPEQSRLSLALQSGAKIFLTHETYLALDGAQYVCNGGVPEKPQLHNFPLAQQNEDYSAYTITPELLAATHAKYLDDRIHYSQAKDDLRSSECSLISEQLENRLAIRKTLLESLFF